MDAHYRRPGYPPQARPLVAFIPQKPLRDPVYQALSAAGLRSFEVSLGFPAVPTSTLFAALVSVHEDARTPNRRVKSYTAFTPSNFLKTSGRYRKRDRLAFKIKARGLLEQN